MSIKNLFFWSYWFSQPYIARGWIFTAWLWAFLILVFIGLLALFISQYQKFTPQRKLWGRAAACFLTMGMVALGWLWLRQERIAFLAWRFWLLLWLVIFVVWVGKLAVYALRRMPVIKKEQAERMTREKYLPKS